MNKEAQDTLWACLPKDVRQTFRQNYSAAEVTGGELYKYTLGDVFGIHNLTSDTEPEEMLMVSRSMIQNKYAYNKSILEFDPNHQGAILLKKNFDFLFGDKCLPYTEEPDAKQKEAQDLSLSITEKKNMSKTIQTEDIIFQDNNRTAKAHVYFCDGELCVSIVAGEKQYDFGLDPATLKMLAYGYKLHCEELSK